MSLPPSISSQVTSMIIAKHSIYAGLKLRKNHRVQHVLAQKLATNEEERRTQDEAQ
jgi:hypothetical protein